MIGYIVYGFEVSEVNFKETDVIKFTNDNGEFELFGGSYLHKLFRNKADAYKQLKSELVKQKESLETKLKDIDLKLKEIEDDN